MPHNHIYSYFHKCCPECGSTHHVQTLCAGRETPEGYIDSNSSHCSDCGWKGIVHDLIPKDKDHGPLKNGHICKHGVQHPDSCVFCQQQISGILSGKFPV